MLNNSFFNSGNVVTSQIKDSQIEIKDIGSEEHLVGFKNGELWSKSNPNLYWGSWNALTSGLNNQNKLLVDQVDTESYSSGFGAQALTASFTMVDFTSSISNQWNTQTTVYHVDCESSLILSGTCNKIEKLTMSRVDYPSLDNYQYWASETFTGTAPTSINLGTWYAANSSYEFKVPYTYRVDVHSVDGSVKYLFVKVNSNNSISANCDLIKTGPDNSATITISEPSGINYWNSVIHSSELFYNIGTVNNPVLGALVTESWGNYGNIVWGGNASWSGVPAGSYIVKHVVKDNCNTWIRSDETIAWINKIMLETPSYLSESIKFHPNPSSGLVTFTSEKVMLLKIYDITSKEVMRLKSQVGVNQIDLSNVDNGVYFIKSDQLNKVERIIISK